MKAGVAWIALAAASPARGSDVERWHPLIVAASDRCGVPIRWIERVLRAESGGSTMHNGLPIRSRAGAMGLMQIMPATWDEMRARLALGGNPDDPRDNLLAGACYLRMMYDRFGYPGLFAAYNAGPGRYSGFLAGRQALPGETVTYLYKVAGSPPTAVMPRSSIFAVRRDAATEAVAPTSFRPAQATLFAIQRAEP